MRKPTLSFVFLILLCIAVGNPTLSAQSPDPTTWDLSEMYSDTASFLAARAALEKRIPDIEDCRGTLATSATRLQQCLELRFDLRREYMELSIYAARNSDRNLRDPEGQKLKGETDNVGVTLRAAFSWIRPEILGMGADKIESKIESEPGLEPFAMYLRDTIRQVDHTLAPSEEELLSRVGSVSGKFSDIYRQLTTSDLPYPTIALPDVGEVLLDQPSYVKYRGSNDREVRRRVFESFWTTYRGYQNTLGTLLNAEVQKNWFYAETRNHPSAVEAALDRNKIPVDVYHSLIDNVRANLPVLHRMLALRKRILGLESLQYSDIYASIVPTVDVTYPWSDGKSIVLAALEPLGSSYVETVAAGMDSWVDVYPAAGKRSGAYSSGGWYAGHPWILLNYNDTYDSVSTTAHELGHAMHSWLSNRTQPYPTSGYSIMAAEVTSTFNEALLKEHMLSRPDDPAMRMLILGNFLERFRQTVFRQTMFAEFELAIHERIENGETLTGDSLSDIYLRLLREYHGHDAGVMNIDDLYAVEWAFIPHFYRRFYVYQYATGMVASTALAEKVLAGEPGALDRYLEFLSSGGSDYPIELLKRAGVDLTTSEPFEISIRAVVRAMDEIEDLLARMETQS